MDEYASENKILRVVTAIIVVLLIVGLVTARRLQSLEQRVTVLEGKQGNSK